MGKKIPGSARVKAFITGLEKPGITHHCLGKKIPGWVKRYRAMPVLNLSFWGLEKLGITRRELGKKNYKTLL